MGLEQLVEVIHSASLENWKKRNEDALKDMFGSRYPKRAEGVVKLRAPDMKGSETGVPYAAYIDPSNADQGAYGGMSFVAFPADGKPCLMGMVIGTQGLAPDEAVLGRPGHARKMRAICGWLNQAFGKGHRVAWAKQDPTRTDLSIPDDIQHEWSDYERVFNRYGNVIYALYKPTEDPAATQKAVAAMLDVMFEERGHVPLAQFQQDHQSIQSNWFAYLMPETKPDEITELLRQRRYVIIQGPPGTGKTRMARELLAKRYGGFGRSIQFHPNTTYETFIGGLAPVHSDGEGSLGFRFHPTPGFLMEAAKAAVADPAKPYLLHIDEINRADLGKVLGEAIYLLESEPESRREIDLAYDFGPPFGRRFYLPANLHILGTMNSADRSIAIVDVAVRRRFAFRSLWPSLTVVKEHGCKLTEEAYMKLLYTFIEHASEDAFELVPGHSYFLASDDQDARRNLQASLAPLLREYLAQGYVSGFAEPIRGYLQWLDSK